MPKGSFTSKEGKVEGKKKFNGGEGMFYVKRKFDGERKVDRKKEKK